MKELSLIVILEGNGAILNLGVIGTLRNLVPLPTCPWKSFFVKREIQEQADIFN
jgi:hypothetical protein